MSKKLDTLIEHFFSTDSSLLQIGACDGKSFDHYRKHILTNDWKCILVEPIPWLFDLLKNTYKNKEVILENIAICDYDGQVEIYTVDKQYYIDNKHNIKLGAIGMSSIYKDKNSMKLPCFYGYINKINCECFTVSTLLTKYNLEYIDQVQIDTEGYDHIIIKNMFDTEIFPRMIRFESNVMSRQELTNCTKLLRKHGYDIIHDGVDRIAFRI